MMCGNWHRGEEFGFICAERAIERTRSRIFSWRRGKRDIQSLRSETAAWKLFRKTLQNCSFIQFPLSLATLLSGIVDLRQQSRCEREFEEFESGFLRASGD